MALQGYMINSSGQMSSQLGSITLPTAALSPKATDSMTVTANLDANATPPATPWDPQNPSTTSNFSTSMTVYDTLGNAHNVNVYFENTGPNQWNYHVEANGSEVQGGTPGQNDEFANGTLTFSSSGALQSETNAGGSVTFNGGTAQTIGFNFGSQVANGGTGLDGMTQFGGSSVVSSQSQDGYASGALSGVQVGSDGTVSGVYTNGQTIAVAQLAIAKFQSNTGLQNVGQNLWAATNQSGTAALGAAGSGGRGPIVSGALEESNVDIASQFVDLIAHQQGFQANSKVIQTASQMLQTLMQMNP
jgi:flagellar hook protein FlgE